MKQSVLPQSFIDKRASV